MNAEKRRQRAKTKAQHNRYARHFGNEEGTVLPWIRIGNQDFGCPFRGKDLFSGMWKRSKDRLFKMENGKYFCIPFCNNKYSVS